MKAGQSKAKPNPAGREGKPFSLAPHSFDDALRKILSAKPAPKQMAVKPPLNAAKPKTKPARVSKGKTAKRRKGANI